MFFRLDHRAATRPARVSIEARDAARRKQSAAGREARFAKLIVAYSLDKSLGVIDVFHS